MGKKNIIFYGAGHMAQSVLDNFDKSLGVPACFCDSNPYKWHTKIMELDVLPWDEAIKRYPDFLVYVTPLFPLKFQIIDELINSGKATVNQIIAQEVNSLSGTEKIKNRDELLTALEPFKLHNLFSDENISGQRLCLFGFSAISRFIVDSIGTKIYCISDNSENLWETEYKGVRIISPSELSDIPDVSVFITDFYSIPRIYEQMKKIGVPIIKSFSRIFSIEPNGVALTLIKNNWIWIGSDIQSLFELFFIANKLGSEDVFIDDEESRNVVFTICNHFAGRVIEAPMINIYMPNQYFIEEILAALAPDECFVDAGAFDGDTIQNFIYRTKGKFEAIHAFEMDRDNFVLLENNINAFSNEIKSKIKLHNCGLWEQKQISRYSSNRFGSMLTSDGDIEVYTERLDDVLAGQRVTFIKMDIEGAEMSALKGSAGIITRQKPKLAIACYHRTRGGDYTGSSDLFDIPAYIKSLVPEYKILIRHHTIDKNCFETVCYAIPPQ